MFSGGALDAALAGIAGLGQRSELPRLEIHWDIHAVTTHDVRTLLHAFERSLAETAIDVLLSEGISKEALAPYRNGKRLLYLKLTSAAVSSFKMRFEIEYSSEAKAEPWLKSVGKGVLKKVAIAWISAIALMGMNQGGGGGGEQGEPGDPGVKSMPALVASLARTGRPSKLMVTQRGQSGAQILIGPGKA
jgi:hypothetical protein